MRVSIWRNGAGVWIMVRVFRGYNPEHGDVGDSYESMGGTVGEAIYNGVKDGNFDGPRVSAILKHLVRSRGA